MPPVPACRLGLFLRHAGRLQNLGRLIGAHHGHQRVLLLLGFRNDDGDRLVGLGDSRFPRRLGHDADTAAARRQRLFGNDDEAAIRTCNGRSDRLPIQHDGHFRTGLGAAGDDGLAGLFHANRVEGGNGGGCGISRCGQFPPKEPRPPAPAARPFRRRQTQARQPRLPFARGWLRRGGGAAVSAAGCSVAAGAVASAAGCSAAGCWASVVVDAAGAVSG